MVVLFQLSLRDGMVFSHVFSGDKSPGYDQIPLRGTFREIVGYCLCDLYSVGIDEIGSTGESRRDSMILAHP